MELELPRLINAKVVKAHEPCWSTGKKNKATTSKFRVQRDMFFELFDLMTGDPQVIAFFFDH